MASARSWRTCRREPILASDHNAGSSSGPSLELMASGHLCLELNLNLPWTDFTTFAEKLLTAIGARKQHEWESVETRMWDLVIGDVPLRLVFDDYPQNVSLESTSADGDRVLEAIHMQLTKGGRLPSH